MAVPMKRSTNIAPDASSTSYLIGSAFIGISMITLNSSGARLPGVTLYRLMDGRRNRRPDVKPAGRLPSVVRADPGWPAGRHPLTFDGLPRRVQRTARGTGS